MKVALISDCYLPRLGGIEVQVHDLAQHLQAAGHDVEVFTATEGAQGERGGVRTVEDGVVVHRHALRLPGRIPVNPLAVPHVRDLLRAGRFDAAHVHVGVVSPFSVSLVPVTLDLGLPTAITWHSVIDRSAAWHRLLGRARRWAEAGAALSAVSAMAAARIEGIARARVAVLGNGIDAGQWRRPDAVAPLPRVAEQERPVRIVSALRLARRKRPQALVEVLAQVRARVPQGTAIEATLFGEGPQRSSMERRLAADGLSWVSLPGRVSRPELREAYWHSDIYLSTARLESFGIAALEAKVAGLVVAARAGTGVEDFVTNGVDGILAADDGDLVDRVATLVADRGALGAMQERVLASPLQHDWPAVVATTTAEYRRAGVP